MEIVWESSTREAYGSGLLTLHVWCDIRSMPEEQQAPLSPIITAAFVSSLTSAYSSKTIRNYLYGIRAWHIFHRVKWEMNEPEMESLLKATKKATPESSKQKTRKDCPTLHNSSQLFEPTLTSVTPLKLQYMLA